MTAAPVLVRRPTWLMPWLDIEPGTEFRTLARFATWAFAAGHDGPAALARAIELNREWGSPLSHADVLALVKRVAAVDAPRAFRSRRPR